MKKLNIRIISLFLAFTISNAASQLPQLLMQ